MKEAKGIPKCTCDGIIKPDVVLYEEGLNEHTIQESVRAISEAQVLIIGGTSLAVYPAAGLIDYFRGDHLVVINKAPTPRDKYADLLIKEPIGKVFSQIHV
jgi:NAD-dependent deacetylase